MKDKRRLGNDPISNTEINFAIKSPEVVHFTVIPLLGDHMLITPAPTDWVENPKHDDDGTIEKKWLSIQSSLLNLIQFEYFKNSNKKTKLFQQILKQKNQFGRDYIYEIILCVFFSIFMNFVINKNNLRLIATKSAFESIWTKPQTSFGKHLISN